MPRGVGQRLLGDAVARAFHGGPEAAIQQAVEMALDVLRGRVAQPTDAVCIAALATQVFLDTYATDGLRPDLAREAFAVYSPVNM